MESRSTSAGPGNRNYVYLISLVAAVGGALFGYDLSIVSGALIFLKQDFNLTPALEGWVVSSAMLGCMIGPYVGSMLADRLGRKQTLMISCLLFAASAIGTALPDHVSWFIFFRIVGGFGVGMASVVSPMYIAEVAPARIRGGLVTMNQLAIVVGSVSSTVVAYFLAAGEHWRWMFASALVPIAALMIGLGLIPESPRWLVSKKRDAEAERILEKIEGADYARSEMQEIRASFSTADGSWREVFAPALKFALLVAIAIGMFQQFTGISGLSFYLPVMFKMAGYESAQAAIFQNIIVNVFQILCTVAALWLLDRAGRRPLLLIGTMGMAIGLLLVGLVFHMKIGGRMVLITWLIANGAYLISLAPLGWLIMSEVFPNHVRAKAMGLCGLLVWVAAFLTTYIIPPLRDYFTERTGSPAGAFWLFAVVSFGAFLFSLLLVPETKGKSLEEIQEMWARRSQKNAKAGAASVNPSATPSLD